MRFVQAVGVACLGTVLFASASPAALLGTVVDGRLTFVGNVNRFDPANNTATASVPSGYGNSAGPSVTIAQPLVEFGYQDEFSRITADFSDTQLTLQEFALTSTGDTTNENFRFIDAAFEGMVPVLTSNSYPVVPVAVITGDTFTVTIPAYDLANGTTNTATFTLIPEPAGLAVAGLVATGLVRRRRTPV